MKGLRQVIGLWQKVPLSWRTGLTTSRVAPALRRLLNRTYSSEPNIFDLAEPLDGQRMKLDWQTQKAFVFGTYECEVTRKIQELVQPGSTAVDIGAHIRYHTLLLAKQVGPTGRVIAFEPLPENFEVLEENVRLNGYHNVLPENKAVVDRSGRVALAQNSNDLLTSTASVVSGAGIEVEAVSLDDYFADSPGHDRVAFIKIDIEGSEVPALSGMAGVLKNDRPFLIVEAHGFDQHGDRHPAIMLLAKAGYVVCYLTKPGPQVRFLAEPRS